MVSTSSGAVKVFGDNETTFTSHAGSANAVSLHPSGDILASVGVDKSFVFYDLPGGKAVTQVNTDSGKNFSLVDFSICTDSDYRIDHCGIPSRWTSLRSGWY